MPDNLVNIYTPESPLRDPRKLARKMFCDLIASRNLAWSLFLRDLRVQYRQSILGYFWLFIPPLVAGVPFIYLHAQGIFMTSDTTVPYAAYALVGTILWQVFVDALNAPLRAFATARPLLTRVKLVHEAVLMSAVAQVGFGSLVRLVLLLPGFVWLHMTPPLTAFLFPLGMLSLIFIGLVVGVLLTPLGLLYNDVQQMLPAAATFLMLMTPVVYPLPHSGFAAKLVAFNPLTPVVATTRDWLLIGPSAFLNAAVTVTTVSAALLLLGWITLRVAAPHLVARVGS